MEDSQEMPNLRRYLACFGLSDNQMTTIFSYLPSKRSIGGTLVDLPIFLDN